MRTPILFCFLAVLSSTTPAADSTDPFYNPEAVQRIDLQIEPADLERLRDSLPQRVFVPGSFRWNEHLLSSVGIRYKGNSSSNRDAPFKRGYLIDFSEFQSGLRFLGLKHVALDNGIQFGSLFSERLITDILRDLGVKASRCNYARLYLNGKFQGIQVNVERIDKPFLERHFGSDRGVLFKVDEGGPGADLRFLGNDPGLYEKAFELQAGRRREAFGQLIELIRAINSPTLTESELRRRVDIDAFIRTTAVLLFAGAFDQYTGWGPHNYYLYLNPADQRWTYLPWDLDVGFADNAFGQVPVLDGWHAAWPAPMPDRPLMEQLLRHPNLLQEYRDQAREILEEKFHPDLLIPKLRRLADQIRSDLEHDPNPMRRVTVPSDRGLADILGSMEIFMRKRYALARAQLDAPGQRPEPKKMTPSPSENGPRPGLASADAPTDLKAIRVTSAHVELRWVNHTDKAFAYVVQRCTNGNAANFVNAIGQGGADITSAIDREVQPGKTYRYRVYGVLPTPQGPRPRGTGVSNEISVTIPASP
ncbi:MAG: CotH kinase family protein [Verrucomicrobiota bacterium]